MRESISFDSRCKVFLVFRSTVSINYKQAKVSLSKQKANDIKYQIKTSELIMIQLQIYYLYDALTDYSFREHILSLHINQLIDQSKNKYIILMIESKIYFPNLIIIKMLKFTRLIVSNLARNIYETNRPTIHNQSGCRTLLIFAFCNSISNRLNSEETNNLLLKRLKNKVQYIDQLEKSLFEQTQSHDNRSSKEQVRKDISTLTPIRTIYDKLNNYQSNIIEIQQMINLTKDPEEKQILQEQIAQANASLIEAKQEAWDLLIPTELYDTADDIIMELRPGAGGAESSIFVKDIGQMYESFCSAQGWRCNITTAVKQTGHGKGYRALDMRIQGQDVHKTLKTQSGVHKVIRVPQTQSKGRLHSSTISVVVMPVVPFSFEVDQKDIKYQFTRSSGPGGQAVNKIQSACRATHIPSGLAVFIQEERSQEMNKKRATDLLKQRLFEIEYKRAVVQEQSKRKSQVTTMDRSEKIRTYNYPQDRITDHRTGLTKFGIKKMMEGEMLEEFYAAFNQSIRKEKIERLLQQLYEEAGIHFKR